MIKKIMRLVIAGLGSSLGVVVYFSFGEFLFKIKPDGMPSGVFGIIFLAWLMVFFATVFYFLSPVIMSKSKQLANYIQEELSNTPLPDLVASTTGLVTGIIIAYFLSSPIQEIPFVGFALTIALYIFLGYLGINIGRLKKDEVIKYVLKISAGNKERNEKRKTGTRAKILDTSVIIDGRIAEIVNTGFIDGKIIIPTFVLEELRHIADSSDDLKRVKGRRGLDILKELQNNTEVEVEINDTKIEEESEVDIKLLKLAVRLEGDVVTNDYNLNKVAQLHNVRVLNINELSNAVKPQLLPGESLEVNIVKEGKENSQGVAYLDDGTMIVVENGKKSIGLLVEVEVTSVLQTPAGRMIFAKILR